MDGWFEIPCKKCGGTRKNCSYCKGEGHKEFYIGKCHYCYDGYVECDCTGGLGIEARDDDCPACDPSTATHRCPACDGIGYDATDIESSGLTVDEFVSLFLG